VRSRLPALACASLFVLVLAGQASASQLIERNPRNVKLAVNRNGMALITYQRQNGQTMHVLAWGAMNARFRPTRPGVPQVKFKIDYSGGWGTFHRLVWKHFRNTCKAYDGPQLPWFVTACKAPDGSYWALQSWQTALPDLGFTPWLPMQSTWWLHLSHWRGPLAKLDVYQDWVYNGRWQELFGQLTYKGVGVRGFDTTRYGAPTDGYGRLLYLDTHNSRYGKGWRRENSFVSHGPPGIFCYGFYPFDPYVNGYAHPRGTPHRKRGPGTGDIYRLTAEGPGVTPDVMWQGLGLHGFDRHDANDVALENQMNAKRDQIRGSWRKCAHS
jgi:hypothetical protein